MEAEAASSCNLSGEVSRRGFEALATLTSPPTLDAARRAALGHARLRMATADIHTLVSLVSARFRSPPACFTWRPAHLTVVSACVGATPEWRALCGVARENHAAYATAQNYGLLFDGCAPLHARSPHWSKIPLLLTTLADPAVEFAFWMDADSVFVDRTAPLTPLLPTPPAALAFTGDSDCFLNSGHLMLTEAASSLLRESWAVYPPPKPWNEQSALVYVLGGARDECRDGVLNVACCGAAALQRPDVDLKPKAAMNAYISDFEPGVSPMIHLAGRQSRKAALLAAYAGGCGSVADFHASLLNLAHAHVDFAFTTRRVRALARHLSDDVAERAAALALRGNGTGGNGTAGVAAAFEPPPLALSGWRGAWSSMRKSQAKRVSAAAAAVAAAEPALRDDLGDDEWLNRLVEAAVPVAHARLAAPTPADFALAPFARALGALEPRIADGLERSRAEACALVRSDGRPAAGMAVARAALARTLCSD